MLAAFNFAQEHDDVVNPLQCLKKPPPRPRLHSLRAASYCWYSQLGMLPAILISVYAGSHLPELSEVMQSGWKGVTSPQLVAGLCVVALLPLASEWMMSRVKALSAGER